MQKYQRTDEFDFMGNKPSTGNKISIPMSASSMSNTRLPPDLVYESDPRTDNTIKLEEDLPPVKDLLSVSIEQDVKAETIDQDTRRTNKEVKIESDSDEDVDRSDTASIIAIDIEDNIPDFAEDSIISPIKHENVGRQSSFEHIHTQQTQLNRAKQEPTTQEPAKEIPAKAEDTDSSEEEFTLEAESLEEKSDDDSNPAKLKGKLSYLRTRRTASTNQVTAAKRESKTLQLRITSKNKELERQAHRVEDFNEIKKEVVKKWQAAKAGMNELTQEKGRMEVQLQELRDAVVKGGEEGKEIRQKIFHAEEKLQKAAKQEKVDERKAQKMKSLPVVAFRELAKQRPPIQYAPRASMDDQILQGSKSRQSEDDRTSLSTVSNGLNTSHQQFSTLTKALRSPASVRSINTNRETALPVNGSKRPAEAIDDDFAMGSKKCRVLEPYTEVRDS